MTTTTMWEGRVAEGRLVEAEGWLRDVALPALRGTAGCTYARGWVGVEQDLVVVVADWDGEPGRHPEPPDGLVPRASAWPFRPVG